MAPQSWRLNGASSTYYTFGKTITLGDYIFLMMGEVLSLFTAPVLARFFLVNSLTRPINALIG